MRWMLLSAYSLLIPDYVSFVYSWDLLVLLFVRRASNAFLGWHTVQVFKVLE